MIDVDHFKLINDHHGHAVGDTVLRGVANAIQAAARKHDSVSRIGGEEFLIVCHDVDARTAVLAAERLRKTVKSLSVSVSGVDIHPTVSIGVACREADMTDADHMVSGADKALYAAKQAGRDRVRLFSRGKGHCT